MSPAYRTITPAELDTALLTTWTTILDGCPQFASPYFRPEFTQQVGAVRADARVTVIEDGGRAVGFFPHQRGRGGQGRPIGGPFSDYHGVIAAPGCDWQLDGLLRAACLGTWHFDHLVGDEARFAPFVRGRATSPQIDLGAGFETYKQRRREAGSDYIVKTEGLARKLGREGGAVTFEVHSSDPAVLAEVIAWKRAQYAEAGIVDAFARRWTGELLARIAATQTPGFAGVCSVLRVDGRPVSVHMGMRSATVLHYWFPGYSQDFAKYSTGIILLLRIAEALAPTGLTTIDLGKGDSQYKQRLMTGAAPLLEGTVTRPSLAGGAHRLRSWAEARAERGGLGTVLRLPLKVVRRLEYRRKFD